MSTVYLGLGTNLGDRIANLDRAVEGLRGGVTITAVSPLYETDAWGIEEQPDFLNMCVSGVTVLNPHDLLRYVKELEGLLGRIPSQRWGPRLIDIDILFYGTLIMQEPELIIPHIGLVERASVLVPLADIAPDFMHPKEFMRISELLENVDASGVRPYQSE